MGTFSPFVFTLGQFLDFYGSNEQTPKMIFFVFVFVTQILRQFLHADDGNE
jgi:hypothetical protein